MFSQDLHENSKYYYLSCKIYKYNEEEKGCLFGQHGAG